jgi:anti-anti-sigma regulatory factor
VAMEGSRAEVPPTEAVQGMRVPTHGRIRPTSSTGAGRPWGGFLLVRRNPRLLHARLTGRLEPRTVHGIRRAASSFRRSDSTLLLILDATALAHISLAAARSLAELEPALRDEGIVAAWVGLNPYLADLLRLACGNEQQVPALKDWPTVQRVFAEVMDRPAPVARGRLVAISSLVH